LSGFLKEKKKRKRKGRKRKMKRSCFDLSFSPVSTSFFCADCSKSSLCLSADIVGGLQYEVRRRRRKRLPKLSFILLLFSFSSFPSPAFFLTKQIQ